MVVGTNSRTESRPRRSNLEKNFCSVADRRALACTYIQDDEPSVPYLVVQSSDVVYFSTLFRHPVDLKIHSRYGCSPLDFGTSAEVYMSTCDRYYIDTPRRRARFAVRRFIVDVDHGVST